MIIVVTRTAVTTGVIGTAVTICVTGTAAPVQCLTSATQRTENARGEERQAGERGFVETT